MITLHAVLGSLVVLLLVVVVTVSCGAPGAIIGGIFGCIWFVMRISDEVGKNQSIVGGGSDIQPVDELPLASNKDRQAFVANLFYGQPQFPRTPARLVGISCIRIVVTDGIPRLPNGPQCGKLGSPTQPGKRQVWILLGEMHTTRISEQGEKAGDMNILGLIKQIHKGFPQNLIDLYYEQGFMHPPAIQTGKDVIVPYGKYMSEGGYIGSFCYPCYALTATAKEVLNPPCWQFSKDNNVRYTQIDPRGGGLVKQRTGGRPERVGQLLWDLAEAIGEQASDPDKFRRIAAKVGQELWGGREGKEDVLRNMPVARDVLIQVTKSAPETATMVYAALLSVSQQLDRMAAVRRQVDALPLEVSKVLEESITASRAANRQAHLANILDSYAARLPPPQLALECLEAGKPHPAMDIWYQLFDDMFNIEVSPILDLYVVARGLRCWRTEVNSGPQTFIVCIEGANHVLRQDEILRRLGGRRVYAIGPTRHKFQPNITLTAAGVVA